ncbi:MAG: RagB/SusD family nutrient uptake outer membrane protein [Paludibacteraceae bacterium]|nr:RagB/SusD family nutrient uptake outer membrane protein [Paludibacteraceae bacterium]
MKTNIKISAYILCMMLTLSFVSCKDMLKEEVYGKPTAEEMLASEENVAKVVGQAYSEMKWLHDHWGYWGINTISSDECVNPVRNPGQDWNDDGYWKGFNDHSWTANDLSFEFVWQYSNAGAVLCNKILGQLAGIEESLDPEIYSRFTAELKVLRCYYYYTLFDAFGRIPYLEDYASENIPQSETWEVWNKLVTTLEEEAPKLPLATEPSKAMNYGRCTQGMAYTLLARLYLNAPSFGVTPANCGISGIESENDFYTHCITACDKVIDSKAYQIESDFFNNFKINNENSEENIFVIVEDGNASFDYRDVAGKMSNKLRITMLTLNYTFFDLWKLKEKPWNGFCAPPDFINKYQYGVDRRGPCDSIKGTADCDGWGWFLGPVVDANGDTLVMQDKGNLKAVMTNNVRALDDATHNDGARLLKYEVAKGGVNKYCDNDFVLLRYADVLYMKAEALLRTGGDINALLADPDFQLIRTRVGLPAYTSLDLDELLDERGREFAWEMVRRRDLIRFNRYSKGSWMFKPAAADNHWDWFPIPRKMIETSGGLWKQNPGYETDN